MTWHYVYRDSSLRQSVYGCDRCRTVVRRLDGHQLSRWPNDYSNGRTFIAGFRFTLRDFLVAITLCGVGSTHPDRATGVCQKTYLALSALIKAKTIGSAAAEIVPPPITTKDVLEV